MEYYRDYLKEGWKREDCTHCSGQGVVWDYRHDDVADCKHCAGGTVWVTPKGRHVEYPGGRFV